MHRTFAIHAERLIRRLVAMPRARKRALMLAADLVFIPAALWAAVALKLGRLPEGFAATPWPYLLAVLVSVPIFVRLGLYRAVVRFIEPKVIWVVLAGVTASTAILVLLGLVLGQGGIPVTAIAIYWAIALVYVGGSRMLTRYLLTPRHRGGDRVAIYGAGMAGAQVASALRARGQIAPVAFVDDDATLHGSLVEGIEVFPPSELAQLIEEEEIKVVLLALPSQTRRRRSQILDWLEPLPVRVMTMPEIGDIVSGAAQVEDVRDVDVIDLLGRDAVPPNERLLDACIRGKAVLVTGAGGSIGSELCRQIIRRQPSTLVLLEMSEPALYRIELDLRREMVQQGLENKLVALLGNPHDKSRTREILRAYGIQTVYHAAAYKHVPIVEQNLIEGVRNNVYSTWRAAEAALETGVETFVLISTDKAVNPTNVMGASKRLAEIVLQSLQTQTATTRFCMVRFGNVLGSSGSVVPLFQEQIRSGGPVTVTHRDVRRFFMTIPEAAQLVLQAGSMGTGGDVFVLDMGIPVQIDDLARRMIKLSGLSIRDADHPDGDIEIQYSGLRPGEKLFEELLLGSNVSGTGHSMIMRAMEPTPTWDEVKELLAELSLAVDRIDCPHAIAVLEKAVPEYRRSPLIHDLVYQQQPAKAGAPELADSKVAVLAEHRAQKAPG
jgi:FlaA1/EpsC-like NDP-sugar epimerase